MKLQHGHIYFVEFDPASGHEFKRVRPAVLISSDNLINRSNLISCVPLTGNTNNVVATDDILIKKDINNNLFFDSVIKTQHVSTFDKTRVKKYIGVLDSPVLKILKNLIIRNFDLRA
ncbi:MAG: type II toxin-antitoxin system PemK/MazF family toxin [Candidatus Gracilibacteria bacterium]|jgi:mRNA interferase MazF